MKKRSIIISLSFLMILSSIYFAQEWSAEQKEVWKVVQTYNEMASKSDVEGCFSYIDESFSGWHYGEDAPSDKSSAKQAASYWFPKYISHYHTLTPAKIWIGGDYAFVHYYFTDYMEVEGEKSWEQERWTLILTKKDGKWLIVGSHGGSSK